jgi:4-hydroxy-tetrahydrodipicolinate reductase
VGLGAIGRATAALALRREGFSLVAAVDPDREMIGRDLGELLGGDPLGVPVTGSLSEVGSLGAAQLAVHTTVSRFPAVATQIEALLDADLDVVSSAEELTYPWIAHPAEARALDKAARRRGRRVLGTGVNPGFLMDALPLLLTGACQDVKRVFVQRTIDASRRRDAFQRKIGAGLHAEDLRLRIAAGEIGHVGLEESLHLLFHALGRSPEVCSGQVEPLLAERPIATAAVRVAPGQVCGIVQSLTGAGDGLEVELRFVAALEAEDEGDWLRIEGTPTLDVHLTGTNGDLATAAILLNAAPAVLDAAPGLRTMLDLIGLHR